MREIKFRAWDKENERMIDANVFAFEEYLPLAHQFEDRQFVFQQFTGLHDKNGKEIYEGDILREVVNIPFIDENPYRIVWDDGGWKWKCLQSERIDYVYQAITKSAEIIGNIWENPSLLGATP